MKKPPSASPAGAPPPRGRRAGRSPSSPEQRPVLLTIEPFRKEWPIYEQGLTVISQLIQRAKDDFVKANLRLVVSIARRFSRGKSTEATYDALWDTISQGQPWHGEFVNRRKDGTEYVERIHVAPIRIHFGSRSYLDKVTMTPREFYRELARNPEHPKTSQPPPGAVAHDGVADLPGHGEAEPQHGRTLRLLAGHRLQHDRQHGRLDAEE